MSTLADALSLLFTPGETVQEINEELPSYPLQTPEARVNLTPETYTQAEPVAHIQDHAIVCDHQVTKYAVVHCENDLLKDANIMLEDFFTSDDVLMSTTSMTAETAMPY